MIPSRQYDEVVADNGRLLGQIRRLEAENEQLRKALNLDCPEGHICANDPIHAQAKIIRQGMQIERLRESLELIARGTWTARNSVEVIVWTVRQALKVPAGHD
jgi:hypothetical protein